MVPYRLCTFLTSLRSLRRLIVHEGTRSMVCPIWYDPQGDSDRPSVGGKDLEEIELLHLDGHKGSKPVRFVPLVTYAVLAIWLMPKVLVMVQLTMSNWYVSRVVAVWPGKLIWLTGHLRWIVKFHLCSLVGQHWSWSRMDCIYLGQKVCSEANPKRVHLISFTFSSVDHWWVLFNFPCGINISIIPEVIWHMVRIRTRPWAAILTRLHLIKGYWFGNCELFGLMVAHGCWFCSDSV